MSESAAKQHVSLAGLVAGLLLLVIGLTAAWLAHSFDDESRSFPQILALLLAGSGLAIAVQSRASTPATTVRRSEFLTVTLAVAAIAVWAAAFSLGAGFLLPTFALQCVLLAIAGMRRLPVILGTAILVSALAHLLFVILLDIPLPASFLPSVFGAI